MISADIKEEIFRRLKATEKEHNVRILLAVESGSRAWGFESPNSDYDVRFVYAHPKDWYIDIDLEAKRDVIEYPIVDDIDLNGWDIRKALKLYWKSNPAFVEWIQSPIIYMEDGCFAPSARELLPSIYSYEKGIYHYRSMAKTNYRGYLRNDLMPIKKYFYVLRPLLAVKWLEKYKQAAPVEFEKMLELISDRKPLLDAILSLLKKKKASLEKQRLPQTPVLNEFIETELERLESFNLNTVDNDIEMNHLNILFHKILDEH